MKNGLEYVLFEYVYNDVEENGNIKFYIDGYFLDENKEGTVIATLTLTPHNDIVIDWHRNDYRFNSDVMNLITETTNNDIKKIIDSRRENKIKFCSSLGSFLISSTSEFQDIARFDYYEADNEEYLYITYKEGPQKRINIGADSCSGIVQDFINNINRASWLMGTDKVSVEKFDEYAKEHNLDKTKDSPEK